MTLKKTAIPPFFEVHEQVATGYKSLYALQAIQPATVLSSFHGELFTQPTRYTVQINANQHLELEPAHLRYTNHSCEPNVFFDTTKRQLVTLQPIKAGEEFTFFYPSTEWKMTEAFECGCNKTNCLGRIQGANYLAYNQLEKYKLTAYVIEKFSELAMRQAKQFG